MDALKGHRMNYQMVLQWFIFPLLVATTPVVGVLAYKTRKQRIADALHTAAALATAAATQSARFDTQDAALARMLEVINPIGAPNLTEVLTRIQADVDANARRLTDHISAAAAEKIAFERRLELLGAR